MSIHKVQTKRKRLTKFKVNFEIVALYVCIFVEQICTKHFLLFISMNITSNSFLNKLESSFACLFEWCVDKTLTNCRRSISFESSSFLSSSFFPRQILHPWISERDRAENVAAFLHEMKDGQSFSPSSSSSFFRSPRLMIMFLRASQPGMNFSSSHEGRSFVFNLMIIIMLSIKKGYVYLLVIFMPSVAYNGGLPRPGLGGVGARKNA